MKEIKIDPKKKDMRQRMPITSQERQTFETLQNVLAIHNIEMDALKNALLKHAISIRQRLGVEEKDAPKGYERFVEFDPNTFDLLVIDRPILQEKEKIEKAINEDNKASLKN